MSARASRTRHRLAAKQRAESATNERSSEEEAA